MLFPLNPPRALHLTSPLMHGPDVTNVQEAVNLWAAAHFLPQVTVDGQYGLATAHALSVVAYNEGITDATHATATKGVIRLIFHPWMRNPGQRRKAHGRQALLAKQYPGIASLPKLAAQYIGVKENPPGSNMGYPLPSHWEQEFGMNGVSWCGCFAGAMILAAGGHVNARVAYTPFIEADARIGANGFAEWKNKGEKGASPGWLVLYNWAGGSTPEHVGIVESFQGNHLTAIEGNTSGSNPSDGGMVARTARSYQFVLGYARPRL